MTETRERFASLLLEAEKKGKEIQKIEKELIG